MADKDRGAAPRGPEEALAQMLLEREDLDRGIELACFEVGRPVLKGAHEPGCRPRACVCGDGR